jgi:hypothetical protein
MHTRQLLSNLCLVIAGGFVSFVDIQPAFATNTLPIMTVMSPRLLLSQRISNPHFLGS